MVSKPDILAIFIGGLGFDQTQDIRLAATRVAGIQIATAGTDNGYKTDVHLYPMLYPSKSIAIIAHSFGCQTALAACIALAEENLWVDYLALIDPVSHDPLWASSMSMPPAGVTPLSTDIFNATNSFPVRRAMIIGGNPPIVVSGTHNSICHEGELISRIMGELNTLFTVDFTATA